MTAAEEVVAFDPYDYAIQDDPYPVYAWLRENAPLYHNTEHDFWALSRHVDVSAASRDETTFSNQMGVSLDPSSWGPQARYAMSFLAMDPPEQTRLRALVSRGFTPRRVQALEVPERGVEGLEGQHADVPAAVGRDQPARVAPEPRPCAYEVERPPTDAGRPSHRVPAVIRMHAAPPCRDRCHGRLP